MVYKFLCDITAHVYFIEKLSFLPYLTRRPLTYTNNLHLGACSWAGLKAGIRNPETRNQNYPQFARTTTTYPMINHYPLDNSIGGKRYPPFEQSRSGFLCILITIKSPKWKSASQRRHQTSKLMIIIEICLLYMVKFT